MALLGVYRNSANSARAYAAWLPLLALPVIWIAVGGWYHLNLLHISAVPRPWFLWAVGNTGYLSAVAGLWVFGDRHYPDNAFSRIAIALAVGAALAFAAFAAAEHRGSHSNSPENAVNAGPCIKDATVPPYAQDAAAPTAISAKSDSGDPLSPLNAVAAVLAVVLAVVTIIATKSASDARAESERARKDILDAINVRILAMASQLLERALAVRTEAEELEERTNEVAAADPDLGRFLSRASMCLRRLERFLVSLHQWVLDFHSPVDGELSGTATLLILDLSLLKDGPVSDMSRLRTRFMLPVGRLIEAIQKDIDYSGWPASDAEDMASTFRKVRKALNET